MFQAPSSPQIYQFRAFVNGAGLFGQIGFITVIERPTTLTQNIFRYTSSSFCVDNVPGVCDPAFLIIAGIGLLVTIGIGFGIGAVLAHIGRWRKSQ